MSFSTMLLLSVHLISTLFMYSEAVTSVFVTVLPLLLVCYLLSIRGGQRAELAGIDVSDPLSQPARSHHTRTQPHTNPTTNAIPTTNANPTTHANPSTNANPTTPSQSALTSPA